MLHAAELLDIAVSAVVVGHQKAVLGNDFSCTSSSELHDCIFEGCVVYVINLLRSELAAQFLHCLAVHFFKEREKPHSFVGDRTACEDGQCCDDAY